MLNLIKKIVIFPFIILWVILSSITIGIIGIIFDNIIIQNIEYFRFFFFGIGVYLISLFFIKPKKYAFWNTFWHEISHIIFAVFTFSKVHKLMIAPDMPENGAAGYVQYSFKKGKILDLIRAHFVSLAPYFFSPITIILVIIYWIILPSESGNFFTNWFNKEPTLNGILFFIGITYIYHIYTSFSQARPSQSDFNSVGYIYGMFFVVFMQLFFLSLILIVLSWNFDSFDLVYEYIKDYYLINYN